MCRGMAICCARERSSSRRIKVAGLSAARGEVRNNTNELYAPGGVRRGKRAGPKAETKQHRRQEGGDHDEDYDGGEEAVVNDADSPPDAGENQADFPARHHADADGPAIHCGGAAEAADQLADVGDHGESGVGDENVAADEKNQREQNGTTGSQCEAGVSKSKAANIYLVCLRLAWAGLELDPLSRIDVHSVDVKNPVKMRAGGSPCGTGIAEDVAALDLRARRDYEFGHVEIHGL